MIPARLLKKVFTRIRISGNSNGREVSRTYLEFKGHVERKFQIRLGLNGKDLHISHTVFCKNSVDILEGDFIIEGIYYPSLKQKLAPVAVVESFVNPETGTTHHKEILLSV